jgi:hypothetical protein
MTTFDIEGLSDLAAMKAASDVTEQWFAARGLQAASILRLTEKYAQRQNLSVPVWATDAHGTSPEAGKAAKFALNAFLESDDPDEQEWARSALSKTQEVKAQIIDPLSIGLILGGLILASRVKKVGPNGVEFYEGIPDGLAKVLKAVPSFFGKLGS